MPINSKTWYDYLFDHFIFLTHIKEEYLSKQEWVALHYFYKKICHPTKLDCELLASALGPHWTAAKVQNWFQHERSRTNPSKYTVTTVEEKDCHIWNDFIASYAFEPDLLLIQQIGSARQRCATLLSAADTKKFWTDIDFNTEEKAKELVKLLEGIYSGELQPKYNSKEEAATLSNLFECNIADLQLHSPAEVTRKGKLC